MIKEFVTRWEENKSKARKAFSEKHPDEYVDIVREVVKALETDEYAELAPDPNRIHIIDDGGYQGTLLFIIAEKGISRLNTTQFLSAMVRAVDAIPYKGLLNIAMTHLQTVKLNST